MNDKNDDPNLELLNQQIWELRRHVESATTLIGGLLLMILVVLVLQSWQTIVGVFLWSIGVLTLIVKASLPFTNFLSEKTGLPFIALLFLTVLVGLITFFVISVATIFIKEWWGKRQKTKIDDHKKMSAADSMRLKREADLEADMQNYFKRKQAYLKEAEQYLTVKKQNK